MKQITLGILQYVQDYDESFPCQVSYYIQPLSPPQWLADGAHPSWFDLQQPYIKSNDVGYCPDDPYAPKTSNATAYPIAGTSGPNPSYSPNSYIMSRYYLGSPRTGGGLPCYSGPYAQFCGKMVFTMPAVAKPANVILLSPATAGDNVTANSGSDVCWEAINWFTGLGHKGVGPALFHSNGSNYSYVDGHVRWNRMEFIPGGSNQTDCGGQVYFNNGTTVPTGATSWYNPTIP